MRFLLMGDRHNSQTKPGNRIDVDFFETVKSKDEEIKRIAKEYNVAAILQAGDFWTDGESRIKNDFVSEVVNSWFDKTHTHEDTKIIGIAGNHDLIGGNIKSLPNTTTGLLDALGYITLVTKENPYIFTMENGKTIAITGTNYHINVDKPDYLDDYIVDKKLGDYHIHIVHGMLEAKGLGPMIRHTTVDQIKHTAADVTFSGHDHIGFNTVEYDGKYFLNSGAIVRLKNDVKEMTRTVKVVILDISDSGIKLIEVPLKSALPGNVVLSREIVERKKEKQFATESMKSQIKQLEIAQKVRFDEILEDVYVDKNIDKSIIEDLSKRLSEKQVEVLPSAIAPVDTWIKEIELKNFQSHEYTKIDFSKNLNVILGESRQGKTSILRALRWLLENKPSGKAMIRNESNYCYVKIKLANGTVIIREIGDKLNGYKIIMPNGEVEEGNTKLVGTVQALCGFNNMEIGSKLSMPINFMRQGSGWYLIGDNVTSTDRARILGAIQNTNSADAVVKDLDKENTQFSTIFKSNNKQVDVIFKEMQIVSTENTMLEKIRVIIKKKILVKNLQDYLLLKTDYEEKCKIINALNVGFNEINIIKCLNEIKQATTTIEVIENSIKIYNEEQAKILIVNEKLKLLNRIPETESKILKLKEQVVIHDVIFENATMINKEQSRQYKIKIMLDKLLKVKSLLDVEYVRTLVNKKDEISKNMATYNSSQLKSKEAKNIIDSTNIVETYIQIKNNILENSFLSENITQYLKDYDTTKKEVKKQSEEIKIQNEKLTTLIETKGKLLKDAKICPTCMGTINEDIVQNLLDKEEY